MKIYTKTGDKGTTALYSGKRIHKYDLRMEIIGTIDELNSWLGLLRDLSTNFSRISDFIYTQQINLFVIGNHLAVDKSTLKDPIDHLPQLHDNTLPELEQEIDRIESKLTPLKHFILPGGHTTVSYCHISRSVCRRLERRLCQFSERVYPLKEEIVYFNRLSDYLFVLCRYLCKKLEAKEVLWKN